MSDIRSRKAKITPHGHGCLEERVIISKKIKFENNNNNDDFVEAQSWGM